MKTQIINVDGMSCQHCVNTITKTLMENSGVEKVDILLEEKKVFILFDEQRINLQKLKSLIEDVGYKVV